MGANVTVATGGGGAGVAQVAPADKPWRNGSLTYGVNLSDAARSGAEELGRFGTWAKGYIDWLNDPKTYASQGAP